MEPYASQGATPTNRAGLDQAPKTPLIEQPLPSPAHEPAQITQDYSNASKEADQQRAANNIQDALLRTCPRTGGEPVAKRHKAMELADPSPVRVGVPKAESFFSGKSDHRKEAHIGGAVAAAARDSYFLSSDESDGEVSSSDENAIINKEAKDFRTKDFVEILGLVESDDFSENYPVMEKVGILLGEFDLKSSKKEIRDFIVAAVKNTPAEQFTPNHFHAFHALVNSPTFSQDQDLAGKKWNYSPRLIASSGRQNLRQVSSKP